MSRYFLKSSASGTGNENFRGGSIGSIHGFLFEVANNKVKIRELMWDNESSTFLTFPRTVFCPPLTDSWDNSKSWYFDSNGMTEYPIERGREIYAILVKYYGFVPTPIEEILNYSVLPAESGV